MKLPLLASISLHLFLLAVGVWPRVEKPANFQFLVVAYAARAPAIRAERLYVVHEIAGSVVAEAAVLPDAVRRKIPKDDTETEIQQAEVPKEFLNPIDTAELTSAEDPARRRGLTEVVLSSQSIPPLPPPASVMRVFRYGGFLERAEAVHRVKPVYPPLARQIGVRGVVVLTGQITKEGFIREVQVISGHPLLTDAAIECVKRWRYRAARLNGESITSQILVSVRFVLN